MRFHLSRDRALGVILGLGLGLLSLSVVAVAIRGWLVIFAMFTFGLPVIVPVGIGIWVGVKLVAYWEPPQLSWPKLLLVAALVWPTAVYLPFGIQFLRLAVMAHSTIPAYPLAERQRISVNWGDAENHGDEVHLFFSTDSDSSEIARFYRDQLLQESWVEGPAHFIEHEVGDTPYWFIKARSGTIHIKIEPANPDEPTEYKVIYAP